MTDLTWHGPGFNSTQPMTSSETSTKNLISL